MTRRLASGAGTGYSVGLDLLRPQESACREGWPPKVQLARKRSGKRTVAVRQFWRAALRRSTEGEQACSP
jgi:hypothetical protein